jgi:Tfp pilus assembly protein PilP
MRLAKSPRTLLPLVLSAALAACAFAQEHPNIQPNAVRDQLNQPAAPQAQSSAPQAPSSSPEKPARPGAPAKAKASAKSAGKSTDKAQAKPPAAGQGGAKADSAKAAKPGKPSAEKPAEEKPAFVRRDPFDTLLTKARSGNAPPENLPPGKAGLVIDTLRIDGIVHSPTTMIAIVSNPQQRVYFLREGDKLYDGSVQKISLDSIAFNQAGKDAFGKPLERVVTKRLYPTPGEQQ